MQRSLPPPSVNTSDQMQQQQHNQIAIPIGPPPPLPLNLPCGQLIEGTREDYIMFCVPLFEALMKGDWIAAKAIFDIKPELVRFAVTKNFDTPLYIAAAAERTKSAKEFVENLVKLMEKKDMELQNKSYNTAFSLAAMVGNVETAKIILEKNKAVLEIPGSQGMMPLYVAALSANYNMVRYLYDISKKMSGDFWTNEMRGRVLKKCVEGDLYDVAGQIVNDCTQLTSNKKLLSDVLLVLAQKTEAFREKEPHNILRIIELISKVKLGHARRECEALTFLKLILNKISIIPNDEIEQILQGPPLEMEEGKHKKITYPSRVLFVAAKLGNVGFIIEILRSYPDLILTVDDEGLTIFHIAVKHRQVNIYNLLYEIGPIKEQITTIEDENGNNMLHLLSESIGPKQFQKLPGFALQMQMELIWFEEVKQMIPLAYRQRKNKQGETPHEIFTKCHEKLVVDGEKWMKETAPQCMVVAALVATVVFAAAFTLPGGYDQDSGLPMFIQKLALTIFVIADAISLISSCTSILFMLSLFISRYSEQDFLESLPKKLFVGLGALFLSVAAMMIAYCASFFLLYNKNFKWVPILITSFSFSVVEVVAFMQMQLQLDVFLLTYSSKHLFKSKTRKLYS